MDFNQHLLTAIFESSSEGIVMSDVDNIIRSVNPAFTEIMGYLPEEIVGQPGNFLRSGKHDDKFFTELWHQVQTENKWCGEMWVRRKNGEIFPEWLVILAIKNDAKEITHYVTIFSDISERVASAERIAFLANFDALTNLPNRTNLYDDLVNYISTANSQHEKFALFSINLDRYKNVNASLGFPAGDLVLQEIAQRLQVLFKDEGIVGRLNGDKFLGIKSTVLTVQGAAHRAEEILSAINHPLDIANTQLTLTATIGISLYPDNGTDPERLIDAAEAAMFENKLAGSNSYLFYEKNMNVTAKERLAIENDMRIGIEKDEYQLFYQPLVNLKTGKISSVEALVRWNKGGVGMISPAKFIPVAEDSGLIIPITDWVIKKACEDNRKWLDANLPFTPVAVNISALYFAQSDFKERIKASLENANVEAASLKLELTEGLAMKNVESFIALLTELRAMGLRLLIDDFGTGYSSLSYLKRFPINDLKIDQSFVRDLVTNAESRAIINAIILLGKSLGFGIIAEGVETKEQLVFLKDNQCDVIQGYYFSKPVPSEEIMKLLKENSFSNKI
ncbi:MAG: EAL domain-containing protein [Gammaproteobacteria bacterium]|nr:EAL domain-containing protein [Gammaproteobacteria bacterium]